MLCMKKASEKAKFTKRFSEALDGSPLRGMSRKKQGLALGISDSMVTQLLTPTNTKFPAMDTAIAIANKTGVSVEWLLTGRGSKSVQSGDKYIDAICSAFVLMPDVNKGELLSYAAYIEDRLHDVERRNNLRILADELNPGVNPLE